MRQSHRRSRGFRVATLIGAVTLDLLFFRPAGLPTTDPTIPAIDLSAAMAVQERHTEDLLDRAGVAGTAVTIGLDGRPAVKVFLSRPNVMGLPAQLEGFSVLTEVTGPLLLPRRPPGGRFRRHRGRAPRPEAELPPARAHRRIDGPGGRDRRHDRRSGHQGW